MSALQNVLFVAFICCLFKTHACSNVNVSAAGIGASRNTSYISPINVIYSNNVLSTSVNFPKNVSSNPQISFEGGSVSSTMETHSGREHVIEPSANKAVTNKPLGSPNLTLTKSEVQPVVESIHDAEVPPQHDDNKNSVPKKGVSFPKFDVSSNSSPSYVSSNVADKTHSNVSGANLSNKTSSTIKPMKPLLTESDSDYIDVKNNSKEDISKQNILTVDQIDLTLAGKKNNRSDYIVPIVAVILSVPLVAILISIIYKRFTDWWQHRNYKRMDFLIEGMYHN